MNFVSIEFLILLALVLLARVTIGRTKQGRGYLGGLILASMVFYAWHTPWYLLLMLFTTAVHYCLAGHIKSLPTQHSRRSWLLAGGVVISLGLLAIFKYADFAITTMQLWLDSLGIPIGLAPPGILLPIGISFYTFHALSYTIDVYRGRIRPARTIWNFLLYMAFFPQLVAGPIVRAREYLYQIERRRSVRMAVILGGGYLVIRGYFLKMVVADNLALVVNKYWSLDGPVTRDSFLATLLVIMFAAQIFADFAGYTDIARGIAYWLGYRLPLNFNSPYIATSFSEFWRRWHISLSSWLRDYLYIPLGGNRGTSVRTYSNLLTVMLLGGLWHGAAVTFIVWGAIHGVALALERAVGVERLRLRWARLAWWLLVQVTVLAAWVFFRSSSTDQAWLMLNNIAALRRLPAPVPTDMSHAVVFLLPVVGIHLRRLLGERGVVAFAGRTESAVWAGLMLYATLTAYGRSFNPFIYFQF